MKRSTRTLLVYGAIGGLLALVLYDNMARAAPSGYTSLTASPDVTSGNLVAAPANGSVAVFLPAGSRGWLAAATGTAIGTSPVKLTPPASPSSPLLVTGVAPGRAIVVQWTDAGGVIRSAVFDFVTPGGVSAIRLVSGLGWHPLMRPG